MRLVFCPYRRFLLPHRRTGRNDKNPSKLITPTYWRIVHSLLLRFWVGLIVGFLELFEAGVGINLRSG